MSGQLDMVERQVSPEIMSLMNMIATGEVTGGQQVEVKQEYLTLYGGEDGDTENVQVILAGKADIG